MKFISLCLALLCVCSYGQVFGGIADFGLDSEVVKQEEQFSCEALKGSKPPAQHAAAEGVPPLPLPAVPIRRTEKKNPPRPPVLVIKIDTGKDGDWDTNPKDIDNLLKWMAKELNVDFSTESKKMDTIFKRKSHESDVEERRVSKVIRGLNGQRGFGQSLQTGFGECTGTSSK
jgi:hypothetical protein